ncbi:MAG: hypothetical protein LBK52_01050 [Deltaproteobacteria bacterium]|jgi:tetratricopeptide (TPR) repeat protein|nr:hypothetical protein [Deltaproteobacteria bacterium]
MPAAISSHKDTNLDRFDQLLDQSLTLFLESDHNPAQAAKAKETLLLAKQQLRLALAVEDRSPEYNLIKARCLTRLMDAMGSMGQVTEARLLLNDLARTPASPEIKVEETRAILNLVTDYAAQGDCLEAQNLYNSAGRTARDDRLILERGRAVIALAAAQARLGRHQTAIQIHRSLDFPAELYSETHLFHLFYTASFFKGLTKDSPPEILKEADRLFQNLEKDPTPFTPDEKELLQQVRLQRIIYLSRCGRQNQARTVFESGWIQRDGPQSDVLLAQSLLALIQTHLDKNQLKEALELYRPPAQPSEETQPWLVKAGAAVISLALKKNQLKKAWAVWSQLSAWPALGADLPARGWAAVSLIRYLAQKSLLPQALEVFQALIRTAAEANPAAGGLDRETVPAPGTAQLLVAAGWAAAGCLTGFLKSGLLLKALDFYQELDRLGQSRQALESRALSGCLLTVYLAFYGNNYTQALEVYRTIPRGGISEASAWLRRQASKALLTVSQIHSSPPAASQKMLRSVRRFWKSRILSWLKKQLEEFEKAQGTASLPQAW